jgi:gliding motility-associated lipoprotein GldH
MALIGLAVMLFSCDSRRVYEKNKLFEKRHWIIDDTAQFILKVADTTTRFNIFMNVRSNLDYPYARLFVNYSLKDSTGHQILSNLSMNDLFDQKTGKPFGQSGIGDIYDHQFLLLKNYRFPRQGHYYLVFQQQMRIDTLTGVMAVGMRLEKDILK